MMAGNTRKVSKETESIEQALRVRYPKTDVYRYNSASIRIRIVDERFRRQSRIQRENTVLPLLEDLPEETRADITVLLLLAPEELSTSLMNLEFEDPTASRL